VLKRTPCNLLARGDPGSVGPGGKTRIISEVCCTASECLKLGYHTRGRLRGVFEGPLRGQFAALQFPTCRDRLGRDLIREQPSQRVDRQFVALSCLRKRLDKDESWCRVNVVAVNASENGSACARRNQAALASLIRLRLLIPLK